MRTLLAAAIGMAALAMSPTSAFAHHNIQHSIGGSGRCAEGASSGARPGALAASLQFATGQRGPVTWVKNDREAERHRQDGACADVQPCEATGVITAVTATTVTVRHTPIAARHWPAMTMTFAVADPQSLRDLAVGDRVGFDLKDGTGTPTVNRIMKR